MFHLSQRRPAPRKRRKNNLLPIIVILLTVLAIAAVGLAIYIVLRNRNKPKPVPVEAPAVTAAIEETTPDSGPEATENAALSPLTEMLDAEDTAALPSDVHVEVTDLSVNANLPAEWKNFLLLGTDDRSTEAGARTDAMIICSVNVNTGAIKLSSILRDLAVDYDIDRPETIYRINAAYAFGGANLAMKTVNELFNMNIEDYVIVNFFGFQELAYRLGGVDIDITEAEMHAINQNVIEQAKIARRTGIDDSDMPLEELVSFGEKTHLDGRQTLGYARIRKLDSDVSRSERQRTVLRALSDKLKDKDISELVSLCASLMPYVETNMSLEEILGIGGAVLGKGLSIEETYFPIRGTYTPDTRNGESMLFDCNFAENAAALHKFIYEQ